MEAGGVHYWRTQVEFYNKVKKKRITGLAKVYMQGWDRLRMEIMGPFGFVKMGTFIVNQGQAKVNFMNQPPYEGPVYDRMFKQMLKVDVSMRDFSFIFTQSDILKNEWSCQNNKEGNFLMCSSAAKKLRIKWSGSMKEPGTNCKIGHPRANIAFKVKSYKFFDEPKDHLFSL